ncbi:type IV secretion protein Rhs [Burkholderia sp. HI2761]|nr:type IV secretion protein Rhs [Burkholderia sp. BE24]OXJ24294.1 type IV secretion protein Rhs [Burkholderia sp. HI2761]
MLDLREYVQAAKAVVGCIAMMIAQEKVTEYFEDHPEDVKKLEHLADEANQQVNELMGGGKLFKDDPTVAEGMKLAKEANKIKNRISDDLGSNVGSGGSSGRPIFVNGMMRATAGTHAYHVPGLHFPLGESFAPPPADFEPSNDGESFMGSKTVLANNDPMSYMALEALSCWSIGMEPPPHNSAHTDRTYPSMPSSVMLPIPGGRPVLVGGPPIMNMAAAAKGLFKAFRGSKWAKALADKLHLKSGFLRCNVLKAEPVDAITGEVIVQQHDFTVVGRLPLAWNRHYASQRTWHGTIGVGWQTPADIRLDLMQHAGKLRVVAYFPDHATVFDAMPGTTGWLARVYDWQYGHALYQHDDHLILRTRAGIEYEFELPARWQHAVDAITEDATLTLLIARIIDLHGNAWAFEWREDRSVARIVEWKGETATGRRVEYETAKKTVNEIRRDCNGNYQYNLLISLTLIDTDGYRYRLVDYERDRNGDLIAALDAMSQSHHFYYTNNHLMVRHMSARGVSFYYTHRIYGDGIWRVERAWGDEDLFNYRFTYDIEHHETRVTDSLGYTSILQANERGMPVAMTDPLGGISSYCYDAKGRTCSETDPASRVSGWEYDEYGNLLTQTLPDKSIVYAEYDMNHRRIRLIAPGGREWQYQWNEQGGLITQTAPTHACTRYEYNQYGQIVTWTAPSGSTTRFSYDRDGNVEEVIDARGRCIRYMHDARAHITSIIDFRDRASHFEYDRNGNLTRAIKPDGQEIHYTYDADGNLLRYRDANDQIVKFEYSLLGQITKRLMPDGTVVQYQYDSEGQLVCVTNELKECYRFGRDALGRIIEETDYWGQSRRYEYGASGELRRSIDPMGQAIVYETDVLGRVVQKYVPDPRQADGIRRETFSYDCCGNLVVASNPDARVELTYDAAGRVVRERQGDDCIITHAYDMSGNHIERRLRIQSSGQSIEHVVRYEYDALDELQSIQIDQECPITFDRDAHGQVEVEYLDDGLRRELSYTSDGMLAKQIVRLESKILFDSEYLYNTRGEMVEKHDSRLGHDRFEYDLSGKVTAHIDSTGEHHRFSYDLAGNRLKTRAVQNYRYTPYHRGTHFDAWNIQDHVNNRQFTFDRIGNLIHRSGPELEVTLRWDGDGLLIETSSVRLEASSIGDRSNVGREVHTCYAYDAFHRRVRKVSEVRDSGDTSTSAESVAGPMSHASRFFWDGDIMVGEATIREADDPIQETDGVSNMCGVLPDKCKWESTAIQGSHCRNREGIGLFRAWFHYPESFLPLAVAEHSIPAYGSGSIASTTNAQVSGDGKTMTMARYWVHVAPNGAPIRLSDVGGNVVWEAAYGAWAEIRQYGSKYRIDQPLRAEGQYCDPETGLYYNRHRYYDPHSGSFISQDPLGLAGGINLFAYGPNSLTWTDPLGLASKESPHLLFAGILRGNNLIYTDILESGGLTAEESNDPQIRLTSHTEPKFLEPILSKLRTRDEIWMRGVANPCRSCKRILQHVAFSGHQVCYAASKSKEAWIFREAREGEKGDITIERRRFDNKSGVIGDLIKVENYQVTLNKETNKLKICKMK